MSYATERTAQNLAAEVELRLLEVPTNDAERDKIRRRVAEILRMTVAERKR